MAKGQAVAAGVVAKKKCPSCETTFPGRFPFCPGCGAEVKGESATPPNADDMAAFDERIKTGVRSVLEECGLVKKPGEKKPEKPKAGFWDDDEGEE